MAHARTLTVESTRFGWIILEDDLNKRTATAFFCHGERCVMMGSVTVTARSKPSNHAQSLL